MFFNMKCCALITGITGQDGSYLAELLLDKGYKVYGIIRRTSYFNTSRIDHIRDRLSLEYGDMQDGSGLQSLISKITRENAYDRLEIYNLAAQSHVKVSFEVPEYTGEVDGIGVLKILEVIKSLPQEQSDKIRFYQAGTSELYGDVLETPQNENTPFNPVSPYAAAKEYAYRIVKIYREGYGLFLVNGILFNHESSRRGESFVTKKIVDSVKEISKNNKQYIELGNLDSKRDWGHAKDYVEAMWLMTQQDAPDDYVVGMGVTHTVKEFVEKSFAYKGLNIKWSGSGIDEVGTDQDGIIRVKVNSKYFRPCEVELLLSDPTKIKDLGWKPYYDLDSLIAEMFDEN
jgi:GDPmannose 4,6-dehydratase